MADKTDNLGQALLEAIDNGAIEVHYQPQMHANGNGIAGVEALVRWRNADGSMMLPDTFMPAVEADAAILDYLGTHTLKSACTNARQWPGIFVSVNVAPLQFTIPGFASNIRDIVERSGVDPKRIELEILENSWFEDPQKAIAILTELRSFGLRVSLDDFGTGYASLAALLQMPLDKLKIDRSFVNNCLQIKSASIIHAIISLARAIGLQVTAEGVETKEQQGFLRTAGCHYLQGYLFSKAVPADEITAMLASKQKAEKSA